MKTYDYIYIHIMVDVRTVTYLHDPTRKHSLRHSLPPEGCHLCSLLRFANVFRLNNSGRYMGIKAI